MSLTLVQVIVSGLLLGAVYALFSSGLTLIWGMMNVVNFAHGDFVMLGMYTAVMVWTALGGGPFAAVPIAAMRDRDPGRARATSCWCATSCAGRCWRRSWAPSAWRCSCATPPSGTSAPTSRPCPTRWSAAPSCWAASASRARACWPASVGLPITLLLHLILTRTAVGSRMLAVSEDATAAQLMGIRPQRMQALAWAMAGAATGIAGALIANFFYTSPTVGETLAIVAFVTVSFGGFGSVLGALVAGLIIGVVESLSAYLIGPVYKDVIVYVLFVLVLWFRPQGLMGKA